LTDFSRRIGCAAPARHRHLSLPLRSWLRTRRERLGLACLRAEGHVIRVPPRRLHEAARTLTRLRHAVDATTTRLSGHAPRHASAPRHARRAQPPYPRRRCRSQSSDVAAVRRIASPPAEERA
jgi:hypothetical protein